LARSYGSRSSQKCIALRGILPLRSGQWIGTLMGAVLGTCQHRERCQGDVRRKPLRRTPVNKGIRKGRSSDPYSAGRFLLHGSNTPQRCLKRSASALGERLPLGSAFVDGGLCLRKPPNVRPVSIHDVGFVAAFESTSPPWPWHFIFVGPTMGARLLSPRASPFAAAR
jgi:hypothetical protein